MRNALLGLLLAVLPTLSGCATSKEIELTLRVREPEQIVANKDDDLAYLMAAINKQEQYVRALERGHIQRAYDFAKAVDNCEL